MFARIPVGQADGFEDGIVKTLGASRDKIDR